MYNNCCKTKYSRCNEDVSILKVYIYNNKCYCLKCARDLKLQGNNIFYGWLREYKEGTKCSNCKKYYHHFCYYDYDYNETKECLMCRNEEDLFKVEEEDNHKNQEQLYNEYLDNGIGVMCCYCKNEIKKTAYGSIIEHKHLQYEKEGIYYCLNCLVKIRKEYGKNIYTKRVFDDEARGIKLCGKCKRMYPSWHYTTKDCRKYDITKNCLECRNREKFITTE